MIDKDALNLDRIAFKMLSFLGLERINAAIVDVPFEFQKGSNKMMRIVRK
jgi:hypothetical protein